MDERIEQLPSVIELVKSLRERNIPEKDYKRHIDWLLELKARNKGVPLSGSFELTPFCNLNCKMCYIHLKDSANVNAAHLTIDTWKSIMQDAHHAGMLNATLTGGECLLYPGFDDLYLFLYSMGIQINIMSNGILINEKRIRFFEHYRPRLIQVTLYGASNNEYKQVTGREVFDIVYDNLKRMHDAHLPVFVSITPNEYMKEDIQKLLSTVKSLHLPYGINSRLIKPRENTGRHVTDLSTEQYIEIYKIQRELNNETIFLPDPSEIPEPNHIGSKRFGLRCGGGRSSFTVQFDGKLTPCIGFHDIQVDLLKISFKDAWKQINSFANQYEIPEECEECIYYSKCIRCPAMHRNAPEKGHCDPQICEHVQKIVAAGIISLPKKKDDL